MSQRDTNKSSTVLRAFTVLEVIAENMEALSVSEVANRTGLDRATAYRMLRTIEQAGYLVRDEQSKTYSLGRRVIALARHLLASDQDRALIATTLQNVSR